MLFKISKPDKNEDYHQNLKQVRKKTKKLLFYNQKCYFYNLILRDLGFILLPYEINPLYN